MEIVTASHVNMEKKVFNPYRGISRSIVFFNVYGFKPFRELVLHYLIGKAHGVCIASVSGNVTTNPMGLDGGIARLWSVVRLN